LGTAGLVNWNFVASTMSRLSDGILRLSP